MIMLIARVSQGLSKRKILRVLAGFAAAGLLAGCASEPVPSDATPSVTIKNGVVWYWQRSIDGGCINWRATADWVATRIFVDSGCRDFDRAAYLEAKGASYSSSFDSLELVGYSDVPNEATADGFIGKVDEEWGPNSPCPFDLPSADLSRLRVVVKEVERGARSEGEARVLSRIAQRLKITDGTGMVAVRGGCTPEPEWDDFRDSPNPWEV